MRSLAGWRGWGGVVVRVDVEVMMGGRRCWAWFRWELGDGVV